MHESVPKPDNDVGKECQGGTSGEWVKRREPITATRCEDEEQVQLSVVIGYWESSAPHERHTPGKCSAHCFQVIERHNSLLQL